MMQQTQPPYSIGDYYYEEGREGVVFWIGSNGFSGKIVHLEGGQADWLNPSRDLWGKPEETVPFYNFCGDPKDGMRNQLRIMAEAEWQLKFPAFAWCASLGQGWYLPAHKEMEQMMKHRDAINKTLRLFNWDHLCLHNDMHRYLDSTYGPHAVDSDCDAAYDDYGDLNVYLDVYRNYIRAAASFSHLDLLEDE